MPLSVTTSGAVNRVDSCCILLAVVDGQPLLAPFLPTLVPDLLVGIL